MEGLRLAFSMFLQESTSWRFPVTAYLPKCSKTHFADPGTFWAFWGDLFVVLCNPRFALSLRFPMVFCDISVWLVLKVRILATISKCFPWFKRLTCPQSSHSRCDFQMFSVIQAFGWPSKCAFSRWFPNVFCDSSAWLVLKIRVFADDFQWVLRSGTPDSIF